MRSQYYYYYYYYCMKKMQLIECHSPPGIKGTIILLRALYPFSVMHLAQIP